MSGRREGAALWHGYQGNRLCYRSQGWESWALQLPEGPIQIVGGSPDIRKPG